MSADRRAPGRRTERSSCPEGADRMVRATLTVQASAVKEGAARGRDVVPPVGWVTSGSGASPACRSLLVVVRTIPLRRDSTRHTLGWWSTGAGAEGRTALDASFGGDRRRSRRTTYETEYSSPPPHCPRLTTLRRHPSRPRRWPHPWPLQRTPPSPGSEPMTTSMSPRSPGSSPVMSSALLLTHRPTRPSGPHSAASATSCRWPRLRRP